MSEVINPKQDEENYKDFMLDMTRSRGVFEGYHEMCKAANVNPFIMCLTANLIAKEMDTAFPELKKVADDVHALMSEGTKAFDNANFAKKLQDFAGQRYEILMKIYEQNNQPVEEKSRLYTV